MRSGLRDANVWGTLPGATDEEIVVFAHHDGYFEAAFDNATGVATMMGIAEVLLEDPAGPAQRTLKFVGTAAHHAGSPGTRWMYDNLSTAMARTVLVINCEHTAITKQSTCRAPPCGAPTGSMPSGGGCTAATGSRRSRSTPTRDLVSRCSRAWSRAPAATWGRWGGCAVDSTDYVAVLLPLRSRSRERRARARARARRARLRRDHRRSQQAVQGGDRAGTSSIIERPVTRRADLETPIGSRRATQHSAAFCSAQSC